ncbi:hypothetical protein BD779DRAFT_1679455 [Infundibulicybe gibba]|nr:hypothetical protein BD779DRAFT_1679455 [Infundibulicybe gibba]
MSDLFPSDEEQSQRRARSTQAQKIATARASKKQEEQKELDALIAAAPGRLAKKAALKNPAWGVYIPGKTSSKRPPPTPNKASEKVKAPKVDHAKSARTSTKSSKTTPPTRDVQVGKRLSKARPMSPARKVKSTATARQYLPPSMEELDESDHNSSATDSDSNQHSNTDGIAMDVDHSDNEIGASQKSDYDMEVSQKLDNAEASQKSDDETEASLKSDDESDGNSDEGVNVPIEWQHRGDSSDEYSGVGDTTLRQPLCPESPTLSRASSVASFTNKIGDLNILNSDLLPPKSVESQSIRHSAAAKLPSRAASPSPSLPSVARGTISASHHGPPRSKTGPPPPPSLASSATLGSHQASSQTARTRSVSSTSESSVQQAMQTTVVVRSSSAKFMDKEKQKRNELDKSKKTSKHVLAKTTAASGQPRLSVEPPAKRVSKQKEKIAKESAGWSDDSATEEKHTSRTKSTVKVVSASVKSKKKTVHAQYDEDFGDVHADTTPMPVPTPTVWPESTSFDGDGLRKQPKHIKTLIHLNIDDVCGDLVFENAYPTKLEAIESATKSLLVHAKKLKLVDILARLKADHEYLMQYVKLSTQCISNDRMELKEICVAQCLTHYEIEAGDHEQARALVKGGRFIFPMDPLTGNLNTEKPFQHPTILSVLKVAFFRSGKSYVEKYSDRFPTIMVMGQIKTAIPKAMVAFVATTLHIAILHTADDSQVFNPDQMKPIYQGFMNLMDLIENEQPDKYKAMMIKIYESVCGSRSTTSSQALTSDMSEAYELIKFSKMASLRV